MDEHSLLCASAVGKGANATERAPDGTVHYLGHAKETAARGECDDESAGGACNELLLI